MSLRSTGQSFSKHVLRIYLVPYTERGGLSNASPGSKERSKGEKIVRQVKTIFSCARKEADAGSWVAQKRERQILVV